MLVCATARNGGFQRCSGPSNRLSRILSDDCRNPQLRSRCRRRGGRSEPVTIRRQKGEQPCPISPKTALL